MGTRQLLCQRQSSIWSDQRNTDEARKRRGGGLHGKSSVLSRKMWEQKVGVMGMDISTDHQKDDFIQNQRAWATKQTPRSRQTTQGQYCTLQSTKSFLEPPPLF
jgi:hypothetical protein